MTAPRRGPPLQLNRRTFIAAALAAGGGGLLAAMGGGGGAGAATIGAATKVKAAGSDLGAIEHVIFFMQENRSFDHYYGSYKGVRGFDDHPESSSVRSPKHGRGGAAAHLLPFHLASDSGIGECTHDLNHTWPAEHLSRGAGEKRRLREDPHAPGIRGPEQRRADHGVLRAGGSSLLLRVGRCLHHLRQLPLLGHGPDASQPAHGALGDHRSRRQGRGARHRHQRGRRRHLERNWPTMPEVLEDAGISWKVYNPEGALYAPAFFEQHGLLVGDAILPYFSQYKDPSSSLYQKAFLPQYPTDFVADVAAGNLPSVSWILPPDGYDEHPPAPPALGEWFTSQMLTTLVSNPDVWSKTVLFHMYDENDGFFDHVPPPTRPPGPPAST